MSPQRPPFIAEQATQLSHKTAERYESACAVMRDLGEALLQLVDSKGQEQVRALAATAHFSAGLAAELLLSIFWETGELLEAVKALDEGRQTSSESN
jgi:hypothetical protein